MPSDKLNKQFSISLTEDEHAALQEKANELGISLSALCRIILTNCDIDLVISPRPSIEHDSTNVREDQSGD